jgi:HTH-type transcriptional regulator/antitoxin HigA
MNNTIEVRPIKTPQDYQETMHRIESLFDCAPGSRDAEVLEILSILADEYENKHFPMEAPDPIEAIKFQMDQQHLSQKDVAKYFGGANRVSEVLNRKRPLTLKMIKALYHHLGIPAEILLA